jgi:DNA-binding CsgD family transcriptional regulator
MDAEGFSALVADVYDAALDPPSWRKVLKDICGFVRGGPSASLFWQDAVKRVGKTYYVWGGDPQYNQLYWDKYVGLNPFTAAAGNFPVGEVCSAADILPLPQFFETPFYKEWMTPQGWGDVLSANLDKSATSRAVFSVARHARDGLVDDEMRHRMRLLVPHVRRSAMIGKLVNLSRVEAAALADTLDGLQAGMFLVDRAGRLMHTNAAGRAMLDEGNVLHANGKLVALDVQGDNALREILLAASSSDAALGEKRISVRLTARDGAEYITHVLPLTSGARRRAGQSYAAVAAIFVQKVGHDAAPGLGMLVEQFGLTGAEVRVLTAIMDHGGVAEVASALKLSPATVRTHLRHVFEKTGVRRQADLVKLMTSYPTPVVSPPDDRILPPRKAS